MQKESTGFSLHAPAARRDASPAPEPSPPHGVVSIVSQGEDFSNETGGFVGAMPPLLVECLKPRAQSSTELWPLFWCIVSWGALAAVGWIAVVAVTMGLDGALP